MVRRFEVDFGEELALCKGFLREDQRNFHCWNYRRSVCAAMGQPAAAGLAFTGEKLRENFSNYSAFHQRSALLADHHHDFAADGEALRGRVAEELALVESAVFTEPADQSAWWYHQFLLTWAHQRVCAANYTNAEMSAGVESDTLRGQGRESAAEWFAGVLRQQLDLMRSLLEIEAGCRWVMTCLLSVIHHLLLVQTDLSPDAVDGAALRQERLALWHRLLEVDPTHSNRYKFHILAEGRGSS